jgi:hypothetical protein
MAQQVHYTAVTETEHLVCDSVDQTVSDGSDIEAVDDLSEVSNNSVLTGQLWYNSRSEDRAKIHYFSAPKPGVNQFRILSFRLFLTSVYR